jgi:hypothetical protein
MRGIVPDGGRDSGGGSHKECLQNRSIGAVDDDTVLLDIVDLPVDHRATSLILSEAHAFAKARGLIRIDCGIHGIHHRATRRDVSIREVFKDTQQFIGLFV